MRVKVSWQPLDVANLPEKSGVYAFKQGERWLYIGKSKNIAKRLTKAHVPFQIALQLCEPVNFLYHPCNSPGKLENRLIEQLQPEWNGYTNSDYTTTGWGCVVFFDVKREHLEAAVATLKFFKQNS